MVRRSLGVALAVASLILAGGVSGQPTRPPATLDDLIAEVQALRAETRQAAAMGVLAHLLMTRLSLQEQRIHTLGVQLTEAHRMLSASEDDRRARAAHLHVLEEALRTGAGSVQPIEFDTMVRQLQAALARSEQDVATLRGREQQLRAALSDEERRWSDVSARLSELEQGLAGGRSP